MKRTRGTSKKLKKDNDNHSPTIDRFGSDFEFLKKLGKGGYGEVVKVRNNLDGRKYAIKKIKLKSYKSRLLEEVKTLSRLNHKYIVRYFHAWIENQSKSANDSDSDNEPDDLFRTKNNDKKPFVVPVKKYKSSSEEDLFPKFKEDGSDDFSYSSDSWMFEDTPPTAVCAMCDKTFTDFEADREAIDRLPKSISIEKLCIDCFNARLRQVGSNISVKASQKKKKPTIPQILYIQMEYCKNTLRRKIDEGSIFNDVDLSWQILGQILQGLAYIHQQGIIHRDLCPGNIFFDDEGNVKIGDFGLATKINSTITDDPKDSNANNTKDNLSDGSSSSSSLEGGTFLYISPEGNHGEKCDIYSLGIIFFEMTFPFRTKMERSNVLQDIRTKQKFPKDFEDVKYAQQHKVIESMLIKDPVSRPKALDLLNGNLLPSSAFSDHAITLESLSCPQSVSFVRVMDTLFSDRKRIITCSEDQIKNSFQVKDDIIRYEQITQKIKNTFKYHSALPTKSNWIDEEIIEAREVFYPSFYDHAEFLLRTGAILHFPYDLRLAFAKKVANNIDQVKSYSPYKRYEIGSIFRKNRNADSPDVFEIANFDIVFHQESAKETEFSLSINNNLNHEQGQMSPRITSPITIRNTPNDYAYPRISFSPEVGSLPSRDGLSSSLPVYRMSTDILNNSSEEIESVIAEAEILRVVLDVMEGLQSLITSYFIVLSHVAFADTLMQVLNISEITKEIVYRIIGATTRDSWSIVAGMLRKDAGLNEDAIEALINYYKIKGTPKQALNDIQIFFSCYQNSHPSATKSVTSAVRHTQLLLQLLDDFLISHRKGVIEINCRLATHNKEFSSGMYFGVIALIGEKKRMQMVGKGGRYDSVVDYFLDKQSSQTSHSGFPSDSEEDKKVGAVGLTLVIDRLVSAYEAQEEVKTKYFDSYVVSEPSFLHERIQFATKLRNAGIIADFSYSKSLSLEAQKSIGSEKAKFVVILDETYYKNGTVRLSETTNKEKQDYYVHRDKIAAHIKPDENRSITPASSPPKVLPTKEVYHSYQGRQTSQQLRTNYYSKLFLSNERKMF